MGQSDVHPGVGGDLQQEADPESTARRLFLDPSGRIAGWGFTSPANFPSLLKACPFDVTTPEDMKAVLQERDALRNPKPEAKEADEAPKPESEAKADNKVPTETATKATPKPKAKPRTRKTGVQVAA